MVGRLVLMRGKGRFCLEEERLGPMRVLRGTVYEPDGLSPRRLARRLRRGERALLKAGVGRLVLGADFPYAQRLTLLRPADPLPFYRAAADVLALGVLALEGVPPERSRVALSAPRLCPELTDAALRLHPLVRGLVIDAPAGADYARYLQTRFGLPVFPTAAGAEVTVAFGPGGGRWGRTVELYPGGARGGLVLRAEGTALPDDLADQVLALLWERGELRRGSLRAERLDSAGETR